jgi:Cu(I)/Ag(I) efflux system membrane fusion protein
MMRTVVLLGLCVALAGAGVLAAGDWKSVVDPYLKVQAALAGDKTDGVSANASAVAAAALKLGPAGAPVVDAARKVAAAADLKAARTAFMDLSETLIAAAGDALAGDIRIAYCPMVKKRWLQTGREIRNPYYGSQMLTCGTFKK